MRLIVLVVTTTVFIAFIATVRAQEAVIRVVDVGQGLCVVAAFPGGYDLLYDAGHWQSSQCRVAVNELVTDQRIEMVVISHSDADHLGELPEILDDVSVGLILWTGFEMNSNAWRDARDVIAQEVRDGASVINLGSYQIPPGEQILLGDATITFVAGWHEWDTANSDSGELPDESERRNAISIVMRIEYGGQSVLLTGDTIGRRRGDADTACRDAERLMVENASNVGIESDVLVAPHHGGNNGGSACFIDAIDPQYVIYSAGNSSHDHPRTTAVERVLSAGVGSQNIFRTDRGDNDGPDEWSVGREGACPDRRGDDDISIILGRESVKVFYLTPSNEC